MLTGDVQDLLPLPRRQAAPDVPRGERETERPESGLEARHARILVVLLVVAVGMTVAVAVTIALALVLPLVLPLGLFGLCRRDGRGSRGGLVGSGGRL
ncbi:MAG: hypothetical protein AUG91_02785 [Actinobacteria bacterium 13_1_20CM_4_69_9]|nr:MAG: hypothetical protein AUG91_02785 [Actinobacteria bacterium 13_1_20CM_4_69_9]